MSPLTGLNLHVDFFLLSRQFCPSPAFDERRSDHRGRPLQETNLLQQVPHVPAGSPSSVALCAAESELLFQKPTLSTTEIHIRLGRRG